MMALPSSAGTFANPSAQVHLRASFELKSFLRQDLYFHNISEGWALMPNDIFFGQPTSLTICRKKIDGSSIDG